MQTLTIARRFCGPAASANGGYFCGLVAAFARESVTVRLARPPPLETALSIEYANGWPFVRHGEHVVAATRSGAATDLVPPARPSHDEAVAAARRYAGFATHPAPLCFVCGPQRSARDGLGIFSGAIAPGVVAGPWLPDGSLDDGRGAVRDEFLWAALDCPGYAALASDMRPMLLGELTADIRGRPTVGEPCTVVGWKIRASGRKHEAGTAVLGRAGDLLATARAIWIEPRSADQ
jgi:hypothetical protein